MEKARSFDDYEIICTDLFEENGIDVSLTGYRTLLLSKEDFELKVRNSSLINDYVHGKLPEAIFCDWIKQQDFYIKFQELSNG